MGKSLSFTGHRPDKLGGYHGPKAEKIQSDLRNQIADAITRACGNGFDTFITGGALGVDQIAAQAVISVREHRNGIRLIIAKPFPSQSCKWPKKSQDAFDALCAQADEVVNVSDDPFTREKMQIRNEWMVDRADAVIAAWNGGNGGTGNCVKYARSTFKPILIINPYTLVEKWEIPPKQKF
jgi:uncharacterized phage-like protein YoqJ